MTNDPLINLREFILTKEFSKCLRVNEFNRRLCNFDSANPKCLQPGSRMNASVKSEDIAYLRGRREDRQRSSEQVRAMRSQLTSGSNVKPEFEYELLRMFVRNEMTAAATMPALSIILSIASLLWATPLEAAIWLVLVISAKVLFQCR